MSIYQKSKLSVVNVNKTFEKKILDNINLSIEDGQIVGIIGPSGVGKTTLFNIISGLSLPDNGNIYLEGEDITGVTSKVSYMLQKDLLLPFYDVYKNISLPLLIKGMAKQDIYNKIMPYIEKFGLKGLENKYPNTLSGGQRQRVALLRTYMFSDEIVLLDEPFSALDYLTKNSMYEWFLNLKKELNLTCLLITHDIDEAIFLSDKIYVLIGSPATLKYEFIIPKDKTDILNQEFIDIKKKILKAINDNI